MGKHQGATIEGVIGAMQELYSKYKFMETHLMKNKTSLKTKIPDNEKTISMIDFLMQKKEADETIDASFNLSDNIFAKAKIHATETVCLWLGANVMLEYTYTEALEMLNRNLVTASEKLVDVNEDLDFLRDQIITAEVNIARIFNYDVKKRRKEKEDALLDKLENE